MEGMSEWFMWMVYLTGQGRAVRGGVPDRGGPGGGGGSRAVRVLGMGCGGGGWGGGVEGGGVEGGGGAGGRVEGGVRGEG